MAPHTLLLQHSNRMPWRHHQGAARGIRRAGQAGGTSLMATGEFSRALAWQRADFCRFGRPGTCLPGGDARGVQRPRQLGAGGSRGAASSGHDRRAGRPAAPDASKAAPAKRRNRRSKSRCHPDRARARVAGRAAAAVAARPAAEGSRHRRRQVGDHRQQHHRPVHESGVQARRDRERRSRQADRRTWSRRSTPARTSSSSMPRPRRFSRWPTRSRARKRS